MTPRKWTRLRRQHRDLFRMVRHTASWERLSPKEKSLIRRYSKKEVIERLTAYRLERLLSGEPTLAVSQSALPLRSELPAVWLAEQQFLPAWSDLNLRMRLH